MNTTIRITAALPAIICTAAMTRNAYRWLTTNVDDERHNPLVQTLSSESDDTPDIHVDIVTDPHTNEILEGMGRVNDTEAYSRCVIQYAKNRFGRPESTKANRLAVRKYVLDHMTSHGVRPTHINQMIDVCVELVFIRNDSELKAQGLYLCEEARIRNAGNRGLPRWRWLVSTAAAAIGLSEPHARDRILQGL